MKINLNLKNNIYIIYNNFIFTEIIFSQVPYNFVH